MKKPNEPQVQPPAERDPNIKASVKITSRVDKIADLESSRYALASVQATPRNEDQVFLTATDGRKLVVVPAEGYVDQERLIPNEMLPKKKPGRKPHVASLNGRWESTEGKFASEPEGRFPRCDDAIPLREHYAGPNVQLTLDPKMLFEIAEALNSSDRAVTLFIRADNSGKVSGGINVLGEHGIGVLMPCVGGDDAGKRFDDFSAEYKRAKSLAKRGVMPWEQEKEAPAAAEEPAQAA